MFPVKIAVATRSFLQPLKQALQTAARIGAGGVQFDVREELNRIDLSETGGRQLLHYLDELNLKTASLSFASRKPLPDPARLEERLQAVRSAMELAYRLKTGLLTIRIGRVPPATDSPEYRTLCEILNDLAKFGNQIGTSLLITPSGESADELMKLISTVTQGPIGVNFDPACYVLSGQNPLEALRTLHSSFLHIQVRDAVRDVDGTGLEVPVGRGEVEWDELLALADEAGYKGWLTIDRTQGTNRIGDIETAIQYLRAVAAGS